MQSQRTPAQDGSHTNADDISHKTKTTQAPTSVPERQLPDVALEHIRAGERAQAILDARAIYSDHIDENARREILALKR